ncbi:MAG: family 78 glycoside hydrolase catalytic domain [bacterium]|nr:family 78 glycoside hydrolase catalytic domain [bacterium]
MQMRNLRIRQNNWSAALRQALDKASWIWLDGSSDSPHQYVCFRKAFLLRDLPEAARLGISADSDFVLYVNGTEAGRGQFSDYPERKTYTELKIESYLKAGFNLINVLAYYRGCDSSEYRSGRPGLLSALVTDVEDDIVSDDSWSALSHPAFGCGDMPRVTPQMGFTTFFDARLDIPWMEDDYDDSAWPCAVVTAGPGQGPELRPRPVAPLKTGGWRSLLYTAYGKVKRRRKEEGTFAEIMDRDVLKHKRFPRMPALKLVVGLPPKDADGRYLSIDHEREEVGLLSICVDASEGTVLDIAHGEHLDDNGRVRARIGTRNFADRYICRQGRNHFILPFRRLGARYLEVHITGMKAPMTVYELCLRPLELEIDFRGGFQTGDATAVQIYDTGRRTLHLCMHEHFEDCPWREQSLYAFDSRNQALYGYYAFGNYDFAGVSLDLLGRGIRPDGLLELCAPARVPVNIPCFSLVWITALAEHMLYSERMDLFTDYQAQIDSMLERVFCRLDDATGLYRLPAGDGLWHFYDWQDGLDGYSGEFFRESADRFDAPYNLFLCEALTAYACMLRQSGLVEKAREMDDRRSELGRVIVKAFWDKNRTLLATYLIDGKRHHFSELVQCMAMHTSILSASRITEVSNRLLDDREELVPVTLSSMIYKVFAFRNLGEAARSVIAREVAEIWGKMLDAGATTFWETVDGAAAFDGAGSLCHGWSALPVYYYQSWVLGIRPLRPGYGSFAVAPLPGGLSSASGTIPTPSGDIRIEWRQEEDGLIVEASGPAELHPCLMPLPEAPVKEARYNGVRLSFRE